MGHDTPLRSLEITREVSRFQHNGAGASRGIALVTSITKRIQVKVEFLDDCKYVTPNPLVKSNDTAFITSFLFKF